MPYPYANFSQITAMVKDAGTDITTWLRLLTASAVDIETYCHRKFYTFEGTRYFNGAKVYPGQHKQLRVKTDDILSVSEIILIDHNGNYTIPLTAYQLVDEAGQFNGFPFIWLQLPRPQWLADNIPGGVKITGVFGYGDGESATPYLDSTDTVQKAMDANTTSIEVSNGELFSPGMLLRIDGEQFYVTAVTLYVAPAGVGGSPPDTNDILTVRRAQNGTVAATHTKDAVIYVYQYPAMVTQCCIEYAAEEWNWRTKYGTSSERIEDYSYTRDKRDYSRLDPYIERHK